MIISTPFPPEEGIGFHVYNLSKKLMDKGHEVSVLTRGTTKFENHEFEGIKIIKAPFFPVYPFHVYLHGFFIHRKLKGFIEENFDIIHFHNPLVPVIKTSLPAVVTMHGSTIEHVDAMELVDFKSFFSKILGRTFSYNISKNLMNYADDVLTISDSVAGQIEEYYHVHGLKVISNGVDIDRFHPVESKAGGNIGTCNSGESDRFYPVKSKWNESKGNYLLYVGRLGHGKGIFDLLNAFKLLNKESDLKLVIAGKGELEGKIRSKIEKESIFNVELLGHVEQEDLIGIYQNAGIFAFPSHYEGLPTAILEAMASGLPIVATDVSGCRDLIEDGYNGLLVPPEDPDELYESVSKLLHEPEFAEYIGKNARLSAERGYSWKSIADKVEKVYKSVEQQLNGW